MSSPTPTPGGMYINSLKTVAAQMQGGKYNNINHLQFKWYTQVACAHTKTYVASNHARTHKYKIKCNTLA